MKRTSKASERSEIDVAMTLYSRPECAQSHRVRLVLAVKGINVEVQDIEGDDLPEDLVQLNPYNSVPTLVDRDLVLYDSRVVTEYLDERFPHPPLMPVDPVTRATYRMALHRVEKDWYGLLPDLTGKPGKVMTAARRSLAESVVATDELFSVKPFFLSDEMSLVDLTIAPILWRLKSWGIELGDDAKHVQQYSQRLFAMEAFRNSLTEQESEMR